MSLSFNLTWRSSSLRLFLSSLAALRWEILAVRSSIAEKKTKHTEQNILCQKLHILWLPIVVLAASMINITMFTHCQTSSTFLNLSHAEFSCSLHYILQQIQMLHHAVLYDRKFPLSKEIPQCHGWLKDVLTHWLMVNLTAVKYNLAKNQLFYTEEFKAKVVKKCSYLDHSSSPTQSTWQPSCREGSTSCAKTHWESARDGKFLNQKYF